METDELVSLAAQCESIKVDEKGNMQQMLPSELINKKNWIFLDEN